MQLDPDFREFVESFNAHEVRYLVVGGDALAAHGLPTSTTRIRSCSSALRRIGSTDGGQSIPAGRRSRPLVANSGRSALGPREITIARWWQESALGPMEDQTAPRTGTPRARR